MRISDWSSDVCSSDLARPVDDRCHPPEGAPGSGQPAQKGHVPRRIGHTKGGLSSKLHAVSDGKGRPPILPLSEGQMSHYKGSADDRCLAQRSEEHTSELQSLMRISYAVFCLKKKRKQNRKTTTKTTR